jgi:hypothetical protein
MIPALLYSMGNNGRQFRPYRGTQLTTGAAVAVAGSGTGAGLGATTLVATGALFSIAEANLFILSFLVSFYVVFWVRV